MHMAFAPISIVSVYKKYEGDGIEMRNKNDIVISVTHDSWSDKY